MNTETLINFCFVNIFCLMIEKIKKKTKEKKVGRECRSCLLFSFLFFCCVFLEFE